MRLSLRETITYQTRPTNAYKVDREAGVIHDVKLLGWESANGRRYDPDAVRAALSLYEGAAIRIDHRQKSNEPRKVAAVFGEARGCEIRPDGLYAKRLEYVKSHELAGQITEIADRFPRQLGMSHDAEGEGDRDGNGVYVVKKITEVRSIDIVVDPATTNGFFEQQQRGRNMAKITFKTLLESQRKRFAKSKARVAWLERLLEDDSMPLSGDMEQPAENADPNDALTSGFEQAIVACFHDDSMDDAAKAKKIVELVKTHGKLTSKDEPDAPVEESDSDPDNDGDADKSKQESKQLRADLDKLKRKDACRDLCESLDFQPTKDQLETLMEQTSDKARKSIAEAFKASVGGKGGSSSNRGGNRPKSSGPGSTGFTEGQNRKEVKTSADLLEAISG